MKAIIVEDEFLAAVCAEEALGGLGVEVIGMAEDSQGAIGLIEKRPQLALVDLNLRDGFTGPALGERLLHAGIKVVFVTANTSQLDAVNAGRAPVLEKPLEPAILAQALRRVTGETHC